MSGTEPFKTELHEIDEKLLHSLRKISRNNRVSREVDILPVHLTRGQKIADAVASVMGSWRFIILQSVILAIWIVLNTVGYIKQWDPYPFILLNLALSFQAAYAAPVIMMSQNRQQEIDREEALKDHNINIKAELEIELLHQKIDQLREQEILNLTRTVRELMQILHQSGIKP